MAKYSSDDDWVITEDIFIDETDDYLLIQWMEEDAAAEWLEEYYEELDESAEPPEDMEWEPGADG